MSRSSTQAHAPWRDTDEARCQQASRMLEVVGQRWSPSILFALARGAERFSEITRAVAGLSARMLTVRLSQLEAAGLVQRTVIPTTPVTVRYHLTTQGLDLLAALEPIVDYVQRWKGDPS
jgi:DNA-binding HxlR family transcriptional regulator